MATKTEITHATAQRLDSSRTAPKLWRAWAGGWGTTHHATEQAARARARRCERATERLSGGPACQTRVWREE